MRSCERDLERRQLFLIPWKSLLAFEIKGGLNQIHIDGLRGSVVERQGPVIALGIAGIALVPPSGS